MKKKKLKIKIISLFLNYLHLPIKTNNLFFKFFVFLEVNVLKIMLVIILFISYIFISNICLVPKTINISYGLNNQYIYPTLISIISILENSKNNTFYSFYLLVEKDEFKLENKLKFNHLEEKYERCNINFLELTNKNLEFAQTKRYPISAYYRLFLSELLPNINRLIYLDGDTLVLNDLTELSNLDMKNNSVLGFVDNSYEKCQNFGIKTYKYVTSGVLLIDLKEMRKENITKKFIAFMKENRDKLSQEDQTVINVVLHGKIDLLPPKYGMWNFVSKKSLLYHNNYENKTLNITAYDENEVIQAWKNPTIIHYVRHKPWKRKTIYTHKEFLKKWWFYAKKSDEYENILKYYKIRYKYFEF